MGSAKLDDSRVCRFAGRRARTTLRTRSIHRCSGFGEVIFFRVCWSTNDSIPVAWKGVYQGVGAGHVLDIVSFDDIGNDSSWKDISDEVAKEVAEIWKWAYGEDWRNQLISRGRQRA